MSQSLAESVTLDPACTFLNLRWTLKDRIVQNLNEQTKILYSCERDLVAMNRLLVENQNVVRILCGLTAIDTGNLKVSTRQAPPCYESITSGSNNDLILELPLSLNSQIVSNISKHQIVLSSYEVSRATKLNLIEENRYLIFALTNLKVKDHEFENDFAQRITERNLVNEIRSHIPPHVSTTGDEVEVQFILKKYKYCALIVAVNEELVRLPFMGKSWVVRWSGSPDYAEINLKCKEKSKSLLCQVDAELLLFNHQNGTMVSWCKESAKFESHKRMMRFPKVYMTTLTKNGFVDSEGQVKAILKLKDNVPIYLKSRNMFLKNNDDPSEDIDLLYELHSSLDIVEEKSYSQDNRDQYLGLLNQNEDRKIFGLLTTTKLKVLLMVSTSTQTNLRDTETKTILKELHNAFVVVTTNNPFYLPGSKLKSKNFDQIVQKTFQNY